MPAPHHSVTTLSNGFAWEKNKYSDWQVTAAQDWHGCCHESGKHPETLDVTWTQFSTNRPDEG
jgi:hypothetical protein